MPMRNAPLERTQSGSAVWNTGTDLAQIELRGFLHQATWHLAAQKMIEACEGPTGYRNRVRRASSAAAMARATSFWITRQAREQK